MANTESVRIAELEAETARLAARLRELDHRIKNDLQLVASVFVLQTRRTPEGPQRELVKSALARVSAVAAVHRRLDVLGEASRLEVSGLVRDVAEEAIAGARRDDVRAELALDAVTLPARQAAPLAIIVSELVRNALAHGLAGRGGRIEVSLAAAGGEVVLAVRDDGPGLADAPRGFGLTLTGLLAQQLRGAVEVAEAEPGVRAVVRFPETPAETPAEDPAKSSGSA